MIYFNQSIYAIVRKENSNQLEMIIEPVFLENEPTERQLCDYYNYSVALGESYAHDLDFVMPNVLKNNYSLRSWKREACAFEHTIRYIRQKYDVVAHSHRKGGWKGFNWQYNNDISFDISTNFGYGNDSYFHIIYKYKNTLLCPYADYVKYQHSTVGNILSNTKSYLLEYGEWEDLMRSTLDFYNAVVNRQADYIIEWVNNNLQQMIAGLKSFVTNSRMVFHYHKYRNGMRISSMATVNDNDFWILKSQKIANSLDFIENFKVLPVEFGALAYIQPILDICKDFLPRLQTKIDGTEAELKKEEQVLDEIKNNELFQLYKRLYGRYYYQYRFYSKSNLSKVLFFMRGLRRLHIQYDIKEIRAKLKEVKTLIDKDNNSLKHISYLKEIDKRLTDDKVKIVGYFEKLGISN